MQYWCSMVSISAFQADGTGSNPVYCSMGLCIVPTVIVAPHRKGGDILQKYAAFTWWRSTTASIADCLSADEVSITSVIAINNQVPPYFKVFLL